MTKKGKRKKNVAQKGKLRKGRRKERKGSRKKEERTIE
jgi:hypothetical protein